MSKNALGIRCFQCLGNQCANLTVPIGTTIIDCDEGVRFCLVF